MKDNQFLTIKKTQTGVIFSLIQNPLIVRAANTYNGFDVHYATPDTLTAVITIPAANLPEFFTLFDLITIENELKYRIETLKRI